MKLTVIGVGRCKEKYWNDAISEYMKRLQRYVKAEIIEVADEKTREEASDREAELVKEAEGKRILAKIPDDAYVIATAIKGDTFDSVEMARRLEKYGVNGISHIILIIGGSLGLSDEVYARCNEKWSFSKLTFPHQMMRVILLEQIYRSYRIMNHEPYHK